MSFSQRVIELRKKRGLTQQGLSDATGIHVQQIKRYEAGSSQPTAEALRSSLLCCMCHLIFCCLNPESVSRKMI
ncbi:helix-turn-helix domain-containing protein [Pectobacterium zantedeschiae]|uniref:helix-turn-helix domain-containing protein n=1 Tax=Pectobacterium zantedeschiae TaxID=2034769 RepID=UPI0037552148